MPYIIKKRREAIEHDPKQSQVSGELSFQICDVIKTYLHQRPNGGFDGAIAHVLAAIEAARIAFEEEIVRPYEKAKREENGAVFEDWHYLSK